MSSRVRWIVAAVVVLVAAVAFFAVLHLALRPSAASAQSCRFLRLTDTFGPTGMDAVRPAWHGRIHRSGGVLGSFDMIFAPRLRNRDLEVDVLHRASACSTTFTDVYRSRFRNTVPPSTWDAPTKGIGPILVTNAAARPIPPLPALSPWSGTLSPRDWTGGCQSGLYTVYVITRARQNYGYGGNDFTCSGG